MCAANDSTARAYVITRAATGDHDDVGAFRTTSSGNVIVMIPHDLPASLVDAYINLALTLTDPRFHC